MDRGHQVPNGLMGALYDAEVATFNMCNIGPQTKRLNEADWMHLEHFLQCLAPDWEFYILDGPLFDKDPYDHCVCHYNTAGVKSCSECQEQYPDGSYKAVPIPVAYWKVVVFSTPAPVVYTWVYDKSQAGDNDACLEDVSTPPCGSGWKQPAIQSIQEAYAGAAGLKQIEANLDITFPAKWHSASADSCSALNSIKGASGCTYKCDNNHGP